MIFTQYEEQENFNCVSLLYTLVTLFYFTDGPLKKDHSL